MCVHVRRHSCNAFLMPGMNPYARRSQGSERNRQKSLPSYSGHSGWRRPSLDDLPSKLKRKNLRRDRKLGRRMGIASWGRRGIVILNPVVRSPQWKDV